MNKKFTYLVAALLAGGSFSAMAANFDLNPTAVTIEKGAQIYLVVDKDSDPDAFTAGDLAIGLTSDGTTLTAVTANNDGSVFDSGSAKVTNYLWTVEESKEAGETYYAFKNAETGTYLAFDGTNYLETDVKDATAANSSIYFTYDNSTGYLKAKNNRYISFNSRRGLILTGQSNASAIYAYKVVSETVSASELNAVLGGDGFSLTPAEAADATEDENNIFSQKIKAIQFGAATNSDTGERIQAGLYFVLDMPEEISEKLDGRDRITYSSFEGDDNQEKQAAYIDAFNECTFIAVSPSESYETSTVEKEGLKLISISGSDLIKYEPQSDPKYATTGDQVYIKNAIFTVTEPDQYGKPGVYTLAVNGAHFIKEAGKDEHTTDNLTIGVTKIQGVNYVTTVDAAEATSFKVSTSSLTEGIDLLKTTKEAAVYTIKFVSGEDDMLDEKVSEYGKYLASANGDQNDPDAYTLVAQGSDLIDTKLPQYQFAITDVNTDNQKVTFTNIETGENFTTQLYATDVENQYKLVGISNDVFVAHEDAKNITKYESKSMNDMVVELDSVEVDPYAGFFQKGIDNNEPYRLAFATNPTTDVKWYVAVDENNDKKTTISETRSLQVVFEPVLKNDEKTIDEESISTRFVYNNNDKVYRAAADLVNYYTYKMRVVDAEDAYLQWTSNKVNILTGATAESNATEVIVKYRYDGSVALVNASSSLDEDSEALSAELNRSKTGYAYTTTYAYAVPNLDNVNLYLEAEKLGVSLAAEPTHVSLEAENGGFINVNDANEGIIAIRTEADEDLTFWVDTTASEKAIPSFYIAKGGKFMFNAIDSLEYYDKMHTTANDNPYEIFINDDSYAKAIFKAGELVNSDTLKTTVDNKEVLVAEKADQNKGILGNIQNFQYQIVKPSDAEDNYVIRVANTSSYLANFNGVLGFISDKDNAMRVIVERQAAPTANEAISATDVKVIALDGAVNVKNAAGKNVVVSTILGQIVANEVLTSDNATISVPAGIAIVSVDGEEAVKVSVK